MPFNILFCLFLNTTIHFCFTLDFPAVLDDITQPFKIVFTFYLKSSNPKLEQGCQISVWAFK